MPYNKLVKEFLHFISLISVTYVNYMVGIKLLLNLQRLPRCTPGGHGGYQEDYTEHHLSWSERSSNSHMGTISVLLLLSLWRDLQPILGLLSFRIDSNLEIRLHHRSPLPRHLLFSCFVLSLDFAY